jgi:hypothetical protein
LAVAPGDRLDAAVLYSVEEGRVAVWSVYGAGDADGREAVGVVLRALADQEGKPIGLPRITEMDLTRETLDALKFIGGKITLRIEARAVGS